MPTLDQLLDFKKGRLSEEDSLWVAECLEQNTMLKGVYDHIENIPFDEVDNLTSKTNQKLSAYPEPMVGVNTFWNVKTISAIAIISLIFIGAIIIIILGNLKDSKLEFSTLSLLEDEVDKIESLPKKREDKTAEKYSSQEVYTVKSDSNTGNSLITEEISVDKVNSPKEKAITVTKPVKTKDIGNEEVIVEVPKVNPKIENKVITEQVEPDVVKIKQKKKETNKKNEIKVSEIKISKKLSVADNNDNSKRTNSPFLQTAPLKDSNSKSDTEKLPYFKGGDEALLDYMKSGLGVTHIAIDDTYSDKLFLNFIVDKQGDIEDWQMYGQVAPEISKKIRKIMDEMPQWNKGKAIGKKGKASYSIIIFF